MQLDPRLEEGTELYSTVVRILGCIEDTWTDIANLKSKYGLHIIEEDPLVTPSNLYLPAQPSLDVQLVKELFISSTYLKTNLEQGKKASSTISRLRKIKWGVKDKDDFEKLLVLLKYYKGSLQLILPKTDASTINLDVLAFLISSADRDTLMQLSKACVLPKFTRSIPNDVEHKDTTYQAIASAATISLEVQDINTMSSATLKINEGDISYDSNTSRLGTYTPPNG